MKIYSTSEIKKIMEATQEVAVYAHNSEHLPHKEGNRDEWLALIAELEFESKFTELLCRIASRLPRL